mgnify:CR=1 FL=1
MGIVFFDLLIILYFATIFYKQSKDFIDFYGKDERAKQLSTISQTLCIYWIIHYVIESFKNVTLFFQSR